MENISTHVIFLILHHLFSFGGCPHEDTCDIISDHLVKDYIQILYKFKQGKKQDTSREFTKGIK